MLCVFCFFLTIIPSPGSDAGSDKASDCAEGPTDSVSGLNHKSIGLACICFEWVEIS